MGVPGRAIKGPLLGGLGGLGTLGLGTLGGALGIRLPERGLVHGPPGAFEPREV